MVKIDVIGFARLISRITNMTGSQLDRYQIEDIHAVVETAVIPPLDTPSYGATCTQVDTLLDAMKTGKKIEAIKAYRAMTGIGLKESKDAVEKYYYGPANSVY